MISVATKTSFAESLFERADKYFHSQKAGKYANSIFYGKATLLLLAYVLSYVYFTFYARTFAELILMAFILGVCHVFIPVNISHDAIHGAISSRKWINHLFLFGFDITGSNSYMYSNKHLAAHFDKENGSKTMAIESQGLLLQKNVNEKKTNPSFAFYFFYAQYMIFVRDFVLYFGAENIPRKEYVKLFAFKTVYVIAFLVLPFVFGNVPWWQVCIALFFLYLVVTASLVIILLMPTEKMEQARINENNSHNDKWLIEVLEHNVDFSPKSVMLNLVAGGANLNVVHYLFPSVNHVHYNNLATIVEKTAHDHGLHYRKQEVRDVFGIHFNYLKNIQKTN
jgi:linoleoyl-CoA desaturase